MTNISEPGSPADKAVINLVSEGRAVLEGMTEGDWWLNADIETGQDYDGETVAYLQWSILRGDATVDDWLLSGQDDRGEFDQLRSNLSGICFWRNHGTELLDRLEAAEGALRDVLSVSAPGDGHPEGQAQWRAVCAAARALLPESREERTDG